LRFNRSGDQYRNPKILVFGLILLVFLFGSIYMRTFHNISDMINTNHEKSWKEMEKLYFSAGAPADITAQP
jgi:hypothetical protein